MKAIILLLLTASICVAAPSKRTLSKLEEKNKALTTKLEQAMKLNTSTSSVNRALQKDLHSAIVSQEKAKKEVASLKRRIQTGRERDVFIVLFSVIAALYFSSMLVGVLKMIPFLAKYSILAQIIAPLVIFVGSFLGVRLLVQLIVKLVF